MSSKQQRSKPAGECGARQPVVLVDMDGTIADFDARAYALVRPARAERARALSLTRVLTGTLALTSPLTTHHSPLTTHHSPLTTHHSPSLSSDGRTPPGRDAAAVRAASLPPVPRRAAKLTRTSRGLRTVRTDYAYQPPACYAYYCTYACQPRACRTYRVPCGAPQACQLRSGRS
eukprot:scaffold47743_cov72-Phaeocystis_antarctica.AAC.1